MNPSVSQPSTLGWREWLALPGLGIPEIKAKVDTGARTSALHTFDLEVYQDGSGRDRVRFLVHPLQHDLDYVVRCDAPVSSSRVVKDSGGHAEVRPFIVTQVMLASQSWEIEISLTSRDNMKFRMLLGRTAMKGRYTVDPSRSYLAGRPRREPSPGAAAP